jgi:pimeloyl-ACP methyl ester carboxylesterase
MNLPPFQTGLLAGPDGAAKPYVTMGAGPVPMVVVPGAADGLRTCVDVAVYLAWFYRHRLEKYRLLILSRRDPIPPDFGVERHADDMIETVERLGWGPAVWECLSAGTPIGQWAAAKRPDLVRGLILASGYAHVSGRLRKVLEQWLTMAQHPSHDDAWSIFEPKYRPPPDVVAGIDPALLAAISAPRGSERMVRLLQPLLDLDQRSLLPRIDSPTLVVGGEKDRTVPPATQREMAAGIPNCRVELFTGYGHFNDMENPAYQPLVDEFTSNSGSRAG